MKRSISSMRSPVLRLPFLGNRLNINGKATPEYATLSIKMLILVVPKSQLVLSIDNVKFVLCGKSEKIRRGIWSSGKIN